MKTGKSLSELAAEIERRASAKKDFVVPAAKVEMITEVVGERPAATPKDKPVPIVDTRLRFGDQQVKVNGVAHRQFGEYLGVPAKYYDRMLAEKPALLAQNFNAWMSEKRENRMMRTLDATSRAWLSDRFRPLENEELAEAVLPPILEMGLMVLSSEITETRMYIKAIDPKILRDVPKGKAMGDGSHHFFDTLSPGIVISNSEVGYGSLAIETAIYTKACTNLCLVPSAGSLKKYHVGGKHELAGEAGYHLLSDKTRRLGDAHVWSQVRDLVKGAFQEAQFNSLVDEKIIGMTEQKIEGDVIKVVDLSAKKFGMTDGEKGSVLKHLIAGGDLTRYGLFNAVTRTAEDLEDYDRATFFERLGGEVIALPKNDWQRLAEAA